VLWMFTPRRHKTIKNSDSPMWICFDSGEDDVKYFRFPRELFQMLTSFCITTNKKYNRLHPTPADEDDLEYWDIGRVSHLWSTTTTL